MQTVSHHCDVGLHLRQQVEIHTHLVLFSKSFNVVAHGGGHWHESSLGGDTRTGYGVIAIREYLRRVFEAYNAHPQLLAVFSFGFGPICILDLALLHCTSFFLPVILHSLHPFLEISVSIIQTCIPFISCIPLIARPLCLYLDSRLFQFILG